MAANDTIDWSAHPFYQWDSLAATVHEEPEFAGVAMLDSVFHPHVEADTLERPSLFASHGLAVEHGRLEPLAPTAAPVWVFGVLLALVALASYYYRTHKLRLADLSASLFSHRAMDRLQRGNNMLRPVQLYPAAALMVACLALPVHHLALQRTGVLGYLLLWAAVSVLYLLRNQLMRLLGVTFGNEEPVRLYVTSNYLYHLLLAVASLPLLFLYFYMPFGKGVVLYVLLGLVAVEMSVRLVRGLQLFLTQSDGSRFYLFYYLCTVELAPILVLAKWIIE